jgi:type II restriction enzyme
MQEYFATKYSSIQDLTKLVCKKNPLNFDKQHGHNFYEYKIKHFLTDSSLGMTGTKVWSGTYDVTGGYLIVKDDGDVLCYHIYNRNQFENYLFANTKFETPSSTKHEFGKVYEDQGQLYFALNLQIRFK